MPGELPEQRQSLELLRGSERGSKSLDVRRQAGGGGYGDRGVRIHRCGDLIGCVDDERGEIRDVSCRLVGLIDDGRLTDLGKVGGMLLTGKVGGA